VDVSGRLLVVDDEPGNRDLLARRLRKVGYEVEVAEDGVEGLRAIEAGDFDLILLDILMPGTSGLDVLTAIRRTRSASELPVVMATALGGSEDTVEALRRGANDYVTKPFDMPVVLARIGSQLSLKRATREIEDLARQLEIRNGFIRRTFGRYVAGEIVDNLLESPEGLELRGEKRTLTILISDLRGFSILTEMLEPVQVVSLLNGYLGAMAEIIQSHGGTIDEFLGDGILAFFGAPVARDDHAERAVAAAVAMQLAMASVNRTNRRVGLPEVEMGIGIATGEVIVGNVGSERRTKYGAVGSTVNLAARIESYTMGGEVLISDATRSALASLLEIAEERTVHPKGFGEPLRIHRMAGIHGRHRLFLPQRSEEWIELRAGLPVRFSVLSGKEVSGPSFEGTFGAVTEISARLRSRAPLRELSNLRIELVGAGGAPLPGAFYAKVATGAAVGEEGVVRFTTRSGALEAALAHAQGREPPG
jgi:adenylate cyclase